MIHFPVIVLAGLFGLAFGSFLNVCLSRWPAGESIVNPRSHCRHCAHTLAWWENIPLLSWLLLRGRCRSCHAWIGWRYPLVELAIGLLWSYTAYQYFAYQSVTDFPDFLLLGYLSRSIAKLILYWLLVALAVFDFEHFWLPDRITLPGAALGFVFQLASGATIILSFHGDIRIWLLTAVSRSLLNIAAATSLILVIRWVYWIIRRQEGIGLGDAKLMALLAAWIGLAQTLLAFGIGVLLGAFVALVWLVLPSTQQSRAWALRRLPLGTFLCIGGIISSIWGKPILAAYLRWAGF
jgi:leader peptidase (prepilin peptidase) / N-methyltransferase